MPTKLNHVAIVSDEYAMVTQFYHAVFDFRPPALQRNFTAATVGDGYVGINVNPRRPARPGGLDHFGVEVDDVEAVKDIFQSKYPKVRTLQRPSNRPFAGITTHDPDGNVFDLSQRRMENRGEIYTESEAGWTQKRTVSHFAIRTMNPETTAEFYVESLGLSLANRNGNDPNYYLTDGRMTLVLMPWSIADYAGTGIVRPGPNHIGIKVESIKQLKTDLERVAGDNPALAPKPVALGPEGEALRRLLEDSVPYATFQMADNNNVLIAVSEG